ncbi:MAG: type V CRISPR-associated protein Cas12b [Verrucomicrobia bacterium]|nr:type V CRISPR-associated protein Cas12b [Verrucomicrobiota bacterium]
MNLNQNQHRSSDGELKLLSAFDLGKGSFGFAPPNSIFNPQPSTDCQMNRIYQGKVTNVEIANPDKTAPPDKRWLPFDADPKQAKSKWQSALWQHHQLFQDAVNYYTLAMAALGQGLPDKHPINQLRNRMAEAWELFPKKTVAPAKNLRNSVCPWLGLDQSTSFGDALDRMVPPSSSQREVRCLAVALLAEKARTLKPQKCANSYWGRFCEYLENEPNWDYSGEELSRKAAAGDWVSALWSEDAHKDIVGLAQSLKLKSLVKCVPGAVQISEEEGRSLLTDAIAHLNSIIDGTKNDTKPAMRTNNWLRQNKDYAKEFLSASAEKLSSVTTECLIAEKARGGGIDINKTHAAALLKAFPCEFTFAYVCAAVSKPKNKKQHKGKEPKQPAIWDTLEARIREIGDDPIRLARVNGQPIFKAFTALDVWLVENSKPCWPDFDKCAFEEALKTLNQFNQKTEDREKRRLEVEAELKYMMGENPDWKPAQETDEADEREVPILKGDSRYERLKTLLTDLDEEGAERAAGEIYGPSRASLRGFGKLREEWMDLFEKANGNPKEADLQEAVTDLQREHKLDMGYTTFFLRLCEAGSWDLWRTDTDTEAKERRANKWATSVIYAAADARELAEEHEHLKEPIRYTPAEPEFSRRLFMFSDIGGTHTAKQINAGLVEVSVATKDGTGKYGPHRVLLHYSAPRLVRDHLSDGSSSKWLQPMMAALGIPADSLAELTRDRNGDAKEPAVALMPDFIGRQRELQMLLNFPVDLDTGKLASHIGKAALWEKQFNQSFENGKLKQRFHLYWPGMENAPEQPWWNNAIVLQKGFTSLGIDLSQRRAADFALLHASTSHDSKTFVELGKAGEQSWHSKLVGCGSLRLPGEDAKVFRDQNENDREKLLKHGKDPSPDFGKKLRDEFHGRSGRSATQAEYDEAMSLAKKFLHDENSAELEIKARNWLGDNSTDHSFPKQNDKLVNLYLGALSRYRTCHRWSWRLTAAHEKEWDKTLDEVRKVPYYAAWSELASKETNADTVRELQQLIATAANNLQQFLQAALLQIAQRVLPLREQTWRWIEHGKDAKNKPLHLLIADGSAPSETPWLRGQRGLSLARIEQLENFRRAVLSLNRLLRHEIGLKPEFGSRTRGESLADPCPELTDKIVRLKEERVNQTAHLIIAQALGVRLKAPSFPDEERERADIHGEYEVMPGRSPVDFIVLEDLSRYTTDKSRSRSENSRLMKWCHRAINEKVKLLAEPFGIAVLEVFASYSSKFDARTGAPGFRAIEVSAADRLFWKKTIEKHSVARATFDCLDNLAAKGSDNVRLVLPQNGGPVFMPAVKARQPLLPVRQADINAAVNIGLRAIAGPTCYHAHPRVRLAKGKSGASKGKWIVRRDNKREKAQFKSPIEVTFTKLKPDSDVLKGENTNLFHDPLGIAGYGCGAIKDAANPPLAHASAIFSRQKNASGKPNGAVARLEWEVCRRINIERLKRSGCDTALLDTVLQTAPPPPDDDDVPM